MTVKLEDLVTIPSPNTTECLYCNDVNFGLPSSPFTLRFWINHYTTRHQRSWECLMNGLPMPESFKHTAPPAQEELKLLSNVQRPIGIIPVGPIEFTDKPPEDCPTILLGTMIRNDGVSLPEWWACLTNQNYPKDRIKVHIIEDNSSDNTMNLLEGFGDSSPFKQFTLVNSEQLPQRKYRDDPKEAKPDEVDAGVKMSRIKEWNSFYNEVWFGMIKDGEADFFTQIHGDILAHPETLNHHTTIARLLEDCGCVGSNGMARGGIVGGAPWVWTRPDYLEVYEDALQQGMQRASVARCTTRAEMAKMGQLVQGAFCGGCFSVTRGPILGGAQFSKWHEETMAPFALKAAKLGYVSYCDRTTQFIHVNHDGHWDTGPWYDDWFPRENEVRMIRRAAK